MSPTPCPLFQAIQNNNLADLREVLQKTVNSTRLVLALEKCVLEQKMDMARETILSPSGGSLEDLGLMLDICLKHMNVYQFISSPLMDAFVERLGGQEDQTQAQQTEKMINTINRLGSPATMHHLFTHPAWQHHATPRQGRSFVTYATPLRPPSFDRMKHQGINDPEPPPFIVHKTFAQIEATLTPVEMVKVWTEFTHRHQHVSLVLRQNVSDFAHQSMRCWLNVWDKKDTPWKEDFLVQWSKIPSREKEWLEQQLEGWKERMDRLELTKHLGLSDASSVSVSPRRL